MRLGCGTTTAAVGIVIGGEELVWRFVKCGMVIHEVRGRISTLALINFTISSGKP